MKDESIIELYWNRDESAINETELKYGSYCRSIAHNILRNREDSEECVNDTYIRTWNSIPPKRPEKLRLFLARITRNLAIDRYKHNTAEKRGGGETDLILDELSEILHASSDVETEIDSKELSASISTFLHTLSQRDSGIFVRRYFFGESGEEIGLRFGMSRNSVGVILSRVRSKLRNHLEKEGYYL